MFSDCGRKLENQKGTHAVILRTESTQKPSPPCGPRLWMLFVFFFFTTQRWTGCVLFSHVSLTGPSQSRHWLFSSLYSHFPSLLFSHCTNFFSSPGFGGAIVRLRLVYEDHWFAQWGLARAWGWEEEGGNEGWGGGGVVEEAWMNCNHIDPQPLLVCLPPKSFPLALGSPPFALFQLHRGTSRRQRQSEARGGSRRRPEVNFCGWTSEYPNGSQASCSQILLPTLLTLSKLTLLVFLDTLVQKQQWI